MATFVFKLPDIGEGIVEGEIVKWLIKEGDQLAEDQAMVEVMTDKATVVIPSPRRGHVARLHGREGEMAKVHQPLVTIETEGASAELPTHFSASRDDGERDAAPSVQPAAPSAGADLPRPAGKVLATPVTRRIAREHGVSLGSLAGSGPGGRVLKSDVLRLVEGGAAAAAQLPESVAASEAKDGDQRLPLRGLRRVIAKRMVQSKFTAPHYTFVEEVDVTELKALRARLKAQLERSGEGLRLSYLPFICKAVAAALRKHPRLNANFDEQAQELVVRSEVNLGIAVATEEGLVVPVVKNVSRKSVRELATAIPALADAARTRRLRQEELSGGTFTITSLGEQGGLFATPIINHPEVAILGIHRMRQQPVVRDGQIVVRDIMYLSLSFDHRVIDGAVGAAFAYEVIKYLEAPDLLLLELG